MNRRGFLVGISSLLAAPAIVRAASIMPVRSQLILLPKPKLMSLVEYAKGFSTEDVRLAIIEQFISYDKLLSEIPFK